jgi:hypothetical protein
MTFLYASGCSFTAGTVQQDFKNKEKSWCYHLGFDQVKNDAYPGNSNQSIFRNALEYFSAGGKADFVAIQLTHPIRREILMPAALAVDILGPERAAIVQRGYYSINSWSVERVFPEQADFYIRHLAGTTEYNDKLTVMGLLALEHTLKKLGIPYVFFSGLTVLGRIPNSGMYSLLDSTHHFMPQASMREYYSLGDQHPDEQQHQDWGEMLAKQIPTYL